MSSRLANKPLITFVVDSREQMPYEFKSCARRDLEFGGSIEVGLGEGDYAVERDGVLLPVRIERKSIEDYFGVVGRGRDRFERELERLRPYRSYLLIEATAQEITRGTERSLVSGWAAMKSALCWSVTYNISPVFAGNRRAGQVICQGILEEAVAHLPEIDYNQQNQYPEDAETRRE